VEPTKPARLDQLPSGLGSGAELVGGALAAGVGHAIYRPARSLHPGRGGQVLAVLTTALALAFVGIVSPAPVGGECPGGERRPVAAVVRDDVVGRDGIEPPTLRFSAARSTD
jgi:hypothetical protein